MSQLLTRHWLGMGLLSVAITGAASAQQAGREGAPRSEQARPAERPVAPPLFFKEAWKQTGPEHGVTSESVTNPNLELKLYDPLAKEIGGYVKNPPPRSIARDWGGPSCIQMAGYNQNPPPQQVGQGQPTDPPNLWTGVCMTPVAATLRDKNNYVDLTGLAKIRWVTRTSGFHVVRPVIRLADGTWLVGDYAEGAHSSNSTFFLETEFPIAPVRWLTLDMGRIVTRDTWIEKPDLSKVDEVGFVDLLPGSGHGWGGFVNLARIEVYGKPVKR